MAQSMDDQIAGGCWGLLVGDALGVPYEFHSPSVIPELKAIEMEPPAGFPRAHVGTPPGTWSDDGAQALVLLASLLAKGQLDVQDLGRRLVNWWDWGYMAVDGRVFDIGIQTRAALSRIREGVSAEVTGPSREDTNGNGSLMRVLPLALWHRGGDAALVRDARRQSLPTHGHPRAGLCCALYCLWARRILENASDPWTSAVRTLRRVTEAADEPEIDLILGYDGPLGTGYVVSTLHAARAATEAGGFASVVRSAIAMGDDTDTTACVAGGIAGLRDGRHSIPARWMETLRGKEIAQPLVDTLIARRST